MIRVAALECELIPLSPIPYAGDRMAEVVAGGRLLARGNTLKGAFSTALRAWDDRPQPRPLRFGFPPAHEMMLRCSNLLVPSRAGFYRGRPVNVSRKGRWRSWVAEAEQFKVYDYLDVGIDQHDAATLTLSINTDMLLFEHKDTSGRRIDDLIAACNRFYLPQFKLLVDELAARRTDMAHNYRFDRWIEQVRTVWSDSAIERSLTGASGCLVRFGQYAGSEARSLNSEKNPRKIKSRTYTGGFIQRRAPRTWWMVAPGDAPLPHAPDVQCAPSGWAFLRLKEFRSMLRPSRRPTSGEDAACALDAWSVPAR